MQHTPSCTSLRAMLAAAIAAGGLVAAPSLAQSSGEDTVAHCRSLLTDAARISCLEEALMGSRPTTQPAAPQTDAQAAALPPTAAVATTTTAAATEDDVPDRRGGLRMPGIPFFGGDDRAERTEVLVSSEDPAAQGFGDEMIAGREGGPPEVIERLTADVTQASEVGYRQLEVVLDNGQVWRQIAADRPLWDAGRYDEPEQVEIYASRTGGYRLHIPETNLTLTVERVE